MKGRRQRDRFVNNLANSFAGVINAKVTARQEKVFAAEPEKAQSAGAGSWSSPATAAAANSGSSSVDRSTGCPSSEVANRIEWHAGDQTGRDSARFHDPGDADHFYSGSNNGGYYRHSAFCFALAVMDFEAARTKLIGHLRGGIRDERVLAAMARVPRELFVPPDQQPFAYEDCPLPIGHDQTISQPFIVALMTQAIGLAGSEKVLEIGTGSGYQSAVLAELAQTVVTVERLSSLAETARKVLEGQGYTNIVFHMAGDTLGWPQDAPYDAIIATAAAPWVPDDLVSQLAIGGRMIIPVGSLHMQDLYKITRQRDGNKIENLGGCRFVSLIGKGAWEAG